MNGVRAFLNKKWIIKPAFYAEPTQILPPKSSFLGRFQYNLLILFGRGLLFWARGSDGTLYNNNV